MLPGFLIYAFGFQECKYAPRKPHATCEADLASVLQTLVGAEHVLLRMHNMWQIRLFIMVGARVQ